MRLTFLGATQTVTGSKSLLQVGSTRVLVDCGLFQGHKELKDRNWAPLAVEPGRLRFERSDELLMPLTVPRMPENVGRRLRDLEREKHICVRHDKLLNAEYRRIPRVARSVHTAVRCGRKLTPPQTSTPHSLGSVRWRPSRSLMFPLGGWSPTGLTVQGGARERASPLTFPLRACS